MQYFYRFILKSKNAIMIFKATKITAVVSFLFAFFTQQIVFAQITASDTVVCQGNSVTLTADTGAFETVTWGPSNIISGSDSGMSINAAPLDTATYFLYTLDTNGVFDTNSIVIYTLPGPINMSASFMDSLCYGETTQITVTGAQSYEWISGNENFLSGTVTDSVRTFNADSLITGGNNRYTVRGAIGSCTFDYEINLRVLTFDPQVTIQGHVSEICFGQKGLTEVSSGGDPNVIFVWNDPDGVLDVTTGENVRPSPNDTTRVQVFSVNPIRARCTGRVQHFEVQGLPRPSLSVTQSSGGSPVCLHGFDTLNFVSDHDDFRFSTPRFVKFTNATEHPVSVNRTEQAIIRVTGDRGCYNEDSVLLQLDPSCVDSTIFFLSVEDLEHLGLEQHVKVYQAGANLKVQSDMNLNGAEFRLVDLSGRIIDVQRIAGGAEESTLQLPNASRGIYIYHIVKDNKVMGAGKLPLVTP